MKQLHYLSLLLLVLMLGACSTVTERSGKAAPIVDRSKPKSVVTPVEPKGPVAHAYVPPATTVTQTPAMQEKLAYVEPMAKQKPSSQAVLALIANAEEQARKGDLAGAVSTIERALRVEPQNARLWNRLAHLRLEQRQYKLAAEMASRSNALSGADTRLMRDNWLIIASAKRAAGDSAGADKAMKKAQIII